MFHSLFLEILKCQPDVLPYGHSLPSLDNFVSSLIHSSASIDWALSAEDNMLNSCYGLDLKWTPDLMCWRLSPQPSCISVIGRLWPLREVIETLGDGAYLGHGSVLLKDRQESYSLPLSLRSPVTMRWAALPHYIFPAMMFFLTQTWVVGPSCHELRPLKLWA